MENRNSVWTDATGECSFLRGALVYLLMGFLVGLQFMLQGSISLMIPELKAEIGLNEVEVGLVSSLFFYPYVLLQIPSGRLLSKLGVRSVLMLSGLVMFFGCLIQAGANGATMMLLGRLVAGIGAAPIIICFLGVIERLFVAAMFGALTAGMEMFGMMGACLGDLLIPDSVHSQGWRFTLIVFAGLALVPVIFAPVLPGNRPRLQASAGESQKWTTVFRDLRVWTVAIYSGLMFAVVNAFGALWAIPYLESNPACVSDAGQMVGMIFLGAAVGAPVLGWLVDRGINVYRVMITCGIGTVTLFLVMLSGELPTPYYYPLLFVIGLMVSAYVLPFIMVKQWLQGEALCVGLGFTNAVSVMIGALFYQPLIGWLIGHYSEINTFAYQQVLMLIPAGITLACVMVVVMYGRISSR